MSRQLNLYFNGDVIFQNNIAENGAGIFITDYCTAVFDKTSNVNNSVNHNGAAIFLNDHSSVKFEQDSVVTFYYDKATNGTVYSKVYSNVIHNGSCQVTYSNSATQFGTAIYSLDNSHVTFAGISNMTFSDNIIPFSDKDG